MLPSKAVSNLEYQLASRHVFLSVAHPPSLLKWTCVLLTTDSRQLFESTSMSLLRGSAAAGELLVDSALSGNFRDLICCQYGALHTL